VTLSVSLTNIDAFSRGAHHHGHGDRCHVEIFLGRDSVERLNALDVNALCASRCDELQR
jgi:hypothetical protein